MADTKISALTTKVPVNNEDYGPIYDAAAVATKKSLLQNYGAYVLDAYMTIALSPADSTTYFYSHFPTIGLVTVAANHKIRIPRTGKILKVYIEGTCTAGSAETSTVSLRLNDTSDTTITSSFITSATPFSFSNTALSIAVTAGDYVTLKWVTASWVTNPTNFQATAKIFIA